MEGTAAAPAAGTVLNALATGTGVAFAIDEYVTASIELTAESGIQGAVAVDDREALAPVVDVWGEQEGTTRLTTTQTEGLTLT